MPPCGFGMMKQLYQSKKPAISNSRSPDTGWDPDDGEVGPALICTGYPFVKSLLTVYKRL